VFLASVAWMLTFFCKRERHGDCPGEWPIGEACGPDHDCSFDMKMVPCACECHEKKEKKPDTRLQKT
jgi:hypothetical protein